MIASSKRNARGEPVQRRCERDDRPGRDQERKAAPITDEIGKLEKLRAGAAGKAKKLVEQYNGDTEAVKRDPEYLKCQAAFKDFSSTLAEKQQRASEIDEDLKQLVANVSGHKTQIQSLIARAGQTEEESTTQWPKSCRLQKKNKSLT